MNLEAVDDAASVDLHEDPIAENEIAELIKSVQQASGDSSIASPATLLFGESCFDHTAMSKLSTTSLKAISRLRSYRPPPWNTWSRLPVTRRAAVLLLLFADRRGELRIVITMRAASLRNYSGHAAFPGGKADTIEETPFQIARREAFEEIGLPDDDSKIPAPFRIEHLCELPYNLAKTELAVRPCVAFLHSDTDRTVDEKMMPKLDAKEVAAVFSAPFHNFLKEQDEVREGETIPGNRSDWYRGDWTEWHEDRWRMHHFHVPIQDQNVTRPRSINIEDQKNDRTDAAAAADVDLPKRFLVWGMTARMLVDAARLAYDEMPEFEHNAHFGDEAMIDKLYEMGRLPEKKTKGSVLTQEDLIKAAAKM